MPAVAEIQKDDIYPLLRKELGLLTSGLVCYCCSTKATFAEEFRKLKLLIVIDKCMILFVNCVEC